MSTTTRTNSNSARKRFTNFSRRFTKENRAEKKLPPDMRKDGLPSAQENPVEPNGDAAPTAAGTMTSPSPAHHANRPSNATLDTKATHSTNTSGSYNIRPPAMHRGPSSILHASSKEFKLPDIPWLCGTWHVTHSTLPMWKDKKNVRITYTRLAGDKLDDLVTYQNKSSTAIQKVAGVDNPKGDGSYLWRGKGWLKIASSRWEVLGWGGGGSKAPETNETPEAAREEREQWVVTYFAKTMFTPAGIDIYSRKGTGLTSKTLSKIKKALAKTAEGTGKETEFSGLVGKIFEVGIDGDRQDMVDMSEEPENERQAESGELEKKQAENAPLADPSGAVKA